MPDSVKERVLIVEDSPTLALTYREYLKPLGLKVDLADTGAKALDSIHKNDPTIILLDLKLPDMDGIDILKTLNAGDSKARVIVITAHGSVTVAVEAMREGASDFLLKPFTAERLTTTVNNVLEISRLARLVQKISGNTPKKFDRFIGDSPVMQATYRMIEDSAPSKASVFIIGESGTGKELCAEAIHAFSSRSEKEFVALNCAAIPANLIESEIFGHVKGAFTGATTDRKGAAVTANGGTLFLDEICEMPLDLQAKLLRFIQTGEIVPVGSNTSQKVDVRFVCATNRIPAEEVAAGRFREDLYYRLHVVPVHLPPLRDRGADVIAIAEQLLSRFAAEEDKSFTGLSDEAADKLLAHAWPGNVRELGNVIQSAVVLNDGPLLTADMLRPILGGLPARSVAPGRQNNFASTPRDVDTLASVAPHEADNTMIIPLADVERKTIERAITLSGGSVHKAAKALGVNPSTLYRKLDAWQKAAP